MHRFLITFLVGTLSTLSAAEDLPHSPTQQYQKNFERVEEKIKDAKTAREELRERLRVLDAKSKCDLMKLTKKKSPESLAQTALNRNSYINGLSRLKSDLKKLAREKKRLESTQIY